MRSAFYYIDNKTGPHLKKYTLPALLENNTTVEHEKAIFISISFGTNSKSTWIGSTHFGLSTHNSPQTEYKTQNKW